MYRVNTLVCICDTSSFAFVRWDTLSIREAIDILKVQVAQGGNCQYCNDELRATAVFSIYDTCYNWSTNNMDVLVEEWINVIDKGTKRWKYQSVLEKVTRHEVLAEWTDR